MAKQTGLGDNCYVAGRNLSGDVGSLGAIGGGNSPREVTGIDKSGKERLGGPRDGRIEFSAFFNDAANQAHPTLAALPRTDIICSYFRGTTLGNQAASIVAKQIGYNPTRGQDASLTIAVNALSNAYGLEWGRMLTAGVLTQAGPGAAGTGVDFGASSAFGLQAYLHVFAFNGTNVAIGINESSDDGGGDPYLNVTGGTFTTVTSAPFSERIQTSRTQTVERYLRVSSLGTFTSVQFAVMVVKNDVSVVF